MPELAERGRLNALIQTVGKKRKVRNPKALADWISKNKKFAIYVAGK